jgi:hypothetical protein
MQRDEVHKGLIFKLVTDYSNVPAGTWATVDAIGTMRDGAWYFTVRWRPYTPIPKIFPRAMTEYSINLWQHDLALFEILTAEEDEAARRCLLECPPPSTLASIPKLGRCGADRGLSRSAAVHPNQLSLFVADDTQ